MNPDKSRKYNEDRVSEFRALGYIPTQEFLDIVGLINSGHNDEKFRRAGVRSIAIPLGDNGRTTKMYHKDDIRLLQTAQSSIIPVAGESNGGKMASRIKSIEERLSKLELFVSQF